MLYDRDVEISERHWQHQRQILTSWDWQKFTRMDLSVLDMQSGALLVAFKTLRTFFFVEKSRLDDTKSKLYRQLNLGG